MAADGDDSEFRGEKERSLGREKEGKRKRNLRGNGRERNKM